jgi:flavodoxin I
MKTLVVYDSTHGHTEKIARAIGEAVGGEVIRVGEVDPADFKGFDLVIVGSSTEAGHPTPEIQSLLDALPALEGLNVTAFDTRTVKWYRLSGGSAAESIARSLEKIGGNLLVPPEGFVLAGTEGPLKDGEIERAATWAKWVVS